MEERLRITLVNVSHCPGPVMILINDAGKAVLYTGDFRVKLWWVNFIIRNPVLIPYTHSGKRLGCLYLDTTFATADETCLEFPSTATGLQELLQKIETYPADTVFYFRAWTLGYEDVWVEDPCG